MEILPSTHELTEHVISTPPPHPSSSLLLIIPGLDLSLCRKWPCHSPCPLFLKVLIWYLPPIKNLLLQLSSQLFIFFTFTWNMDKTEPKSHIHTLVHKYFQVASNKFEIFVDWQNEKKMAVYSKQRAIHWNLNTQYSDSSLEVPHPRRCPCLRNLVSRYA